MDWPNPWQAMEPWRRVALVVLAGTVALAYVARSVRPSTDAASRVVVVVACLVGLLVWASRPKG